MRSLRISVFGTAIAASLAFVVFPETHAEDQSDILRQRCLEAMRRATRFMVEKVSTNGGYVWQYLPDLSRRWGEMEAYPTMIWLQPPGTASMGHVFLDAHEATGDEYYYEAAEKAARALIWGQLDCGGWNYMIDFAGDRSLKQWYATIGKNGWRLEEFQHYYGNATFDDRVSTDAARLLLRMYLARLDPSYTYPLDRAIRFVLDSQYPSGGWPQRYPLRNEFSHHGKPDYTSFITFNDDVVWENVSFLMLCYMTLGQERLLDPIRRGMNVYLLTQQGPPQAGWAQQYTPHLKPDGARTYEPEALSPDTTADHVELLILFYRLTGETKYLARIPEALDWLDRCRLPQAMTENNRYTHPTFVELITDRPLFVHRRGANVVHGAYYVDYDDHNLLAHYGGKRYLDVARLRREYERIKTLSVEEATKDSALLPRRSAGDVLPQRDFARLSAVMPARDERLDLFARSVTGAEEIERIVNALDGEGRWLSTYGIMSHSYGGDGQPSAADDRYATTEAGDESDTSPFRQETGQKYVTTSGYIRNMHALLRYVATNKRAAKNPPNGN